MNSRIGAVVATYQDRYGETKTIHGTKFGLRVKNDRETPFLKLAPVIGAEIIESIAYAEPPTTDAVAVPGSPCKGPTCDCRAAAAAAIRRQVLEDRRALCR